MLLRMLLGASLLFSLVHGLHPIIKELLAQRGPSPIFEYEEAEEFMTHLRGLARENEAYAFVEVDEGDEGRLPEHDCIKMNEQMYMDTFFGPNGPPKEKWVLAFTRRTTAPAERNLFQPNEIIHVFKTLAELYKGKVRFAWIDTNAEEKLREMFFLSILPAVAIYDNGTILEQKMFWYSLKYLPQFIEEGVNDHTLSDVWPARPIYSETELRLKYVYNYILGHYRVIRSELRDLTYTITILD